MTTTPEDTTPPAHLVLTVEDLAVHVPTEHGLLRAVDGVSFEVRAGRTLGIVGESGSGKSLTAKSLLRLHPAAFRESGRVLLHGADGSGADGTDALDIMELRRDGPMIRAVRGRRIALIFQEPMTAFSPLHTIGDQIMEAILLHRTADRAEARDICLEWMLRVGIGDAQRRIDQYPHEFSGGMRQRAMIAMALSCEPEILIADEPTTALDVTVQAQILDLIAELGRRHGMAVLLITHDLGVVAEVADRVVVLNRGSAVETGDVMDVLTDPADDYTRALLRATPRLELT